MSEWKPTQRPILCRTLSAYLALIQSSMARALGREKLEGGSWTTSASVTLGDVSKDRSFTDWQFVPCGTHQDVHRQVFLLNLMLMLKWGLLYEREGLIE